MQLDTPKPGSPADWLRHARNDLALAGVPLPKFAFYNSLCFHAQQSVEKSLKAILVHHAVEFRKVHDIAYLTTLLPKTVTVIPELNAAASLTSYAVVLRYPGDYEEVSIADYQDALQIAQAVLNWAEQMIQIPPQAGSNDAT